MKKVLEQISINAIKFEDFNFTTAQKQAGWLGYKPASEHEIDNAEQRLGIKFPQDYKDFLFITNGFSAPNDIEPSFERVENVVYLKSIDIDIIEAYDLEELKESIVIGGLNEEQYFLLIPPSTSLEKWKYWKFANWHPGEQEFSSMENYFKDVLQFQNNQ